MSGREHTIASLRFGKHMVNGVDRALWDDISVERDFPSGFSDGGSEVNGDFDVVVTADDVAHHYEIKTDMEYIASAFDQLYEGKSFLESRGYNVVSTLVITDERFKDVVYAREKLGNCFKRSEIEYEVPNLNYRCISQMEEAGLTVPLEELLEEDKPSFNPEHLEQNEFGVSTDGGYSTSGAIEDGNGVSEPVYHFTPRVNSTVYFDASRDLEKN